MSEEDSDGDVVGGVLGPPEKDDWRWIIRRRALRRRSTSSSVNVGTTAAGVVVPVEVFVLLPAASIGIITSKGACTGEAALWTVLWTVTGVGAATCSGSCCCSVPSEHKNLTPPLVPNPLPLAIPAAMPFNRYPFKLMLIAKTTTIHLLSTGSPTRLVHADMKSSNLLFLMVVVVVVAAAAETTKLVGGTIRTCTGGEIFTNNSTDPESMSSDD